MLLAETGTIVRALPQGAVMEIKMRRQDGSALILEIAGDRPDLAKYAREARMDGTETLVRYTSDGRIVGFAQTSDAIAA